MDGKTYQSGVELARGIVMIFRHTTWLGTLPLLLTGCAALTVPTQGPGVTGPVSTRVSPVAFATSSGMATRSYFVSLHGNDAGDGSATQPFSTLGRAVHAMETTAIKSTCLASGTYILPATLILRPINSGESILACPGQVPVLSGGGKGFGSIIALRGVRAISISGLTFIHGGSAGAVSLSGTNDSRISGNCFQDNVNGIVLIAGSSHNIIWGNEIDQSAQSAIDVDDGSNTNRFENNTINHTGAIGTFGGGFHLHGVSNNIISRNLVENTAGMGIGVENWDNATINIGNIIEYNRVENANTAAKSIDSGAIYVLGRSQIDTGMVIQGNFVNGTGAAHPAHSVGIYLDDLSSGIVVRNNILTGIGSDAVQIHGGQNNTIENNIIDIGSGRASAVLFQAAPADTHSRIPMTGNYLTRNIIYSSSNAPVLFVDYRGGRPTVAGNLYYNVVGAPMLPSGTIRDLRPAFGDPGFFNVSEHDYSLKLDSIAFSIGFTPIDQDQIGPVPRSAEPPRRISPEG